MVLLSDALLMVSCKDKLMGCFYLQLFHKVTSNSVVINFVVFSLDLCVDQTKLYDVILAEIKHLDDPFIPPLFCFSRDRRKYWSGANQMVFSSVELCIQEAAFLDWLFK